MTEFGFDDHENHGLGCKEISNDGTVEDSTGFTQDAPFWCQSFIILVNWIFIFASHKLQISQFPNLVMCYKLASYQINFHQITNLHG